MINQPEFQALRLEYIQGSVERTAHLQQEAARLRAGEAIDLRQLRQEIHKFRGSGGFYGFADLSGAAGAAEDQLILILDGETELNHTVLAGLIDRVVDRLQAAAAGMGL